MTSEINVFEYATRSKMRFLFKGLITVEDLWDLPVTDLDEMFKELNAKKRSKASEESLLGDKSKEDESLDIQIAIIKHIVAVKLREKEKKEKEAENRAKRQKIIAIMAERNDKSLEQASDEELQRMLDELK